MVGDKSDSNGWDECERPTFDSFHGLHTQRVYNRIIPMTKRINIILPETTIGVLNRLTTTGNRSRFIDRAVLHYVESRGKAPSPSA